MSFTTNCVHQQSSSYFYFYSNSDVKNILTIKKYNNIISYSVNTVQYICLIFS